MTEPTSGVGKPKPGAKPLPGGGYSIVPGISVTNTPRRMALEEDEGQAEVGKIDPTPTILPDQPRKET